MKKKIIVIFLFLFILTACGKKEITKENFVDIASFNGYIIENSKSGYEKYHYIKDIYYAINRDNVYFVQLLELENEEYAKKYYDINKQEIIKEENDLSYVKARNKQDYSFYHMENESNYMLVIQSSNKVLYVSAPISYINEIEEFLDEMDLDY